jgi:hypothetical protein
MKTEIDYETILKTAAETQDFIRQKVQDNKLEPYWYAQYMKITAMMIEACEYEPFDKNYNIVDFQAIKDKRINSLKNTLKK